MQIIEHTLDKMERIAPNSIQSYRKFDVPSPSVGWLFGEENYELDSMGKRDVRVVPFPFESNAGLLLLLWVVSAFNSKKKKSNSSHKEVTFLVE